MALDYECDGCGEKYDLNNYSGGSTCYNCGGKIELIRDEEVAPTFSVFRKILNDKQVLVVFPIKQNMSEAEALKLKAEKIEEALSKLKAELEKEFFVQKD